VYQKAAFNSPVWFNCGFEKAPQCSACFINSVQDTMDSILTLARTEGMLFVRSGGHEPVADSFFEGAFAGGGQRRVRLHEGLRRACSVIKSGARRRAAKMVILAFAS
jgi:ribonucleoside-diphosphate reductase alpha chain